MMLTQDIDLCQICRSLVDSNKLMTSKKPYVEFQVEEKWKPKKVKILFVAESPPWNGEQRYFYNPNIDEKDTNLRKEVLKHLNIDSLEKFKEIGCFLVDSIKCRINKNDDKNVPRKVLNTCTGQFLRREITDLKPKTVFVLGNSAKQALQNLPGFKDLRRHKITDDYDKILSGHRVILCVYPGRQTRHYENRIKHVFSKIQFL